MSPKIDQYAVFGNPIEHSKSPIIHSLFAQQTEQNMQYTANKVDIDRFAQTATAFFAKGGKGLNITVPFKLDAYQFADQLTERAARAGAVNTLILSKQGHILGDNTDGQGMVDDILHRLGWPIKNKKVLVLGAGGAVRGILEPLLKAEPASVVITNRTFEKANQLASDFSDLGQISAFELSQLAALGQVDMIINGTSASLQGAAIDLPESLIHHQQGYCYDMMYAAELTPFLRWGQQLGAQVADGLGMLVGQAAESFYQWRHCRPETNAVIDLVRRQLSE